MENNKKTLILSILGVLVLVIAVVGVSFAMYSFSATGTTENVIQTGSVSVSYENESVISLTNQYPMTNDLGKAQTGEGNVLTFDVRADIAGTINIKYDLALTEITYSANTLTDSNVRFALYRDGALVPEMDSKTFKEVKANMGNNYIPEGYVIDSGLFTESDTVAYELKAWIDKDYKLPGQAAIKGTCSDTTYTNKAACEDAGATWTLAADTTVAGEGTCSDGTSETKEACEAANGTWSIVHSETTDVVTVTFKVKVVAQQA